MLASLPDLDRTALLELYGNEALVNISHSLLMRAGAYRLQEQALGGLKPTTRRFLEQAAEDASAGRQISAPSLTIKSGTRLLREWHGVTHEVMVADDGVLYRDKRYRSLSEVARVITGVKWSGPLFFGLKKAAA